MDERRQRLIKRARKLGDKAAEAILTADRSWRPEPEGPPMRLDVVWAGLRWTGQAA